MPDISSSAWSTTDANNNQDSPNGWNVGTTQSQTIAIMQAQMGAVKRLWERMGAALTSTGSANNYIVTPTNTAYPTSLVQGDIIGFIASFGNSGAATVSYNGLTGIPIKKQSSTGPVALSGNEIKSGQAVMLQYDGSALQMVSQLASTSSASGSVTSVGMTGDGVVFNSAVTGSPVTSSGSLAPSLKTQAAHLALLGPASGTGAPTFRSIALGDLPAQTGSGSIVLETSPTISTPTISSPSLTGVPTAPTATVGNNTTQLATTAFVQTAVGGGGGALTAWTPSLEFGGATTGITYNTQSGKYFQSGKMIIADFTISLTSKGSASGNATITGFPVAALAGTATSVIITAYQNMSSITGSMVTNLTGTTASLSIGGSTGQNSLTDGNFSNTTIFNGMAIYFTA